MKNLKKGALRLAVVFTILLAVAACDGNPSAKSWPLEQPENAYEIDAWGTNPDLLEFTPKGNPGYFCVLAVSGMDELKTMFCMPKKEGS
jgi:hypothetical protein